MNTDGTLFSMKKNSREAEAMSMTSFMIPIGLKQKLKDHAAKLGTTQPASSSKASDSSSTGRTRRHRNWKRSTPRGADEIRQNEKAIKNTIGSPSHHRNRPAQAWALASAPRGKMHWTSASKQNRLSTRRKTNERKKETHLGPNALSDAIEPAKRNTHGKIKGPLPW